MLYISSSIIVQLLTGTSDYFKNLKDQGIEKNYSNNKIWNSYDCWFTGYGVAVGIENAGNLV